MPENSEHRRFVGTNFDAFATDTPGTRFNGTHLKGPPSRFSLQRNVCLFALLSALLTLHCSAPSEVTTAIGPAGSGQSIAAIRGAEQPNRPARTLRRVAIILGDVCNAQAPSFTRQHAYDVVFKGPTSLDAYLREVSFGQVGLTSTLSDVYGWYGNGLTEGVTLPGGTNLCRLKPDQCPTSHYNSLILAWMKKVAGSHGFDESRYDHTIYVMNGPAEDYKTCGFHTAQGSLPIIKALAPGANSVDLLPLSIQIVLTNNPETAYGVGILAHELGHNFGLGHAGLLTCLDGLGKPTIISNNCTIAEYGDPFDVMGGGEENRSGLASYYYSAYHRAVTGWLPSGNTLVVTSNGDYTLTPPKADPVGIQLLRIPIEADDQHYQTHYALEFLQPYGFNDFSANDPVASGVLIRRVTEARTDTTQLLDMTPQTMSADDAPLRSGQTFTDDAHGIRVTVNSVSRDGARVNISIPTYSSVNEGTGTGLHAEYFKDSDFAASALVRVDPVIDFNWDLVTRPDPAVSASLLTFSARWTGAIQPRFSETYTFYIVGSTPVRFWVNDRLIIDNWNDSTMLVENKGTIDLSGGQPYSLRLETKDLYYSSIRLLWSSDSQPKEIVPQHQLYDQLTSATSPSDGGPSSSSSDAGPSDMTGNRDAGAARDGNTSSKSSRRDADPMSTSTDGITGCNAGTPTRRTKSPLFVLNLVLALFVARRMGARRE